MADLELERPEDGAGIEVLLDRAYGNRHTKTSQRLRDGRAATDAIGIVARVDGALVGTVRLWPVVIGRGRPALLLGPLAVDAAHRGQGIGAALVAAALREAAARAHRAVILVGDASYYGRFGFRAESTRGLTLPGPVDRARFLGLELAPGALEGARGGVRMPGRSMTRILRPMKRAA
jgi:predicted N-acetyltransferase YhbS